MANAVCVWLPGRKAGMRIWNGRFGPSGFFSEVALDSGPRPLGKEPGWAEDAVPDSHQTHTAFELRLHCKANDRCPMTAAYAGTSSPSCNFITRSHRAAVRRSCVTSTIAWPSLRVSEKR